MGPRICQSSAPEQSVELIAAPPLCLGGPSPPQRPPAPPAHRRSSPCARWLDAITRSCAGPMVCRVGAQRGSAGCQSRQAAATGPFLPQQRGNDCSQRSGRSQAGAGARCRTCGSSAVGVHSLIVSCRWGAAAVSPGSAEVCTSPTHAACTCSLQPAALPPRPATSSAPTSMPEVATVSRWCGCGSKQLTVSWSPCARVHQRRSSRE